MGSVVRAETIDAGRAVHALGVEQLEVAMEDSWLQTVRLTVEERDLMQRLTERSRLDQGEAEAIALASVRGLRLIVDDQEARSVAAASGVEHLGTAGTLLECQGRSKFGPLRRSKSRPVGEGVAVFVGRLERSLRSPFRAAQA